MSGKREALVTMTSTEATRLRNSARWAAESEQQSRQREQNVQNALNAAIRERDVLNNTLNHEINGLQDDIRSMANEQNRRFMEQANEYNRRLQSQIVDNNRRLQEQNLDTDRKLRNREADFNGKLENQRRELQSSINEVSQRAEKFKQELISSISDVKQQTERNRLELQNQINGINARIEARDSNAKRLAELWISQTQAYISDIEQYRHDMFKPGDLDRLKGRLGQMLSDMENRVYEAAISTARERFYDAVKLKEDVLNAETEWLYYQGLFLQTLADTEANLNYCENLQFTFEMEHGMETVDAEVNYWTNGILDEITNSITEVKQQTEHIHLIQTQQLIDFIDTLNRQNILMEEASAEAKEVIILSQNRKELANKLADALEDIEWECERITYEGEEKGQPVHAKFSDGMGNEIVAIISPIINTQNMDNKLTLDFFDERNYDEGKRQTWIASIQNSLRKEGLEISEIVCVPGYENEPSDNIAIRDIDATARRKIERSKNPRIKTS